MITVSITGKHKICLNLRTWASGREEHGLFGPQLPYSVSQMKLGISYTV